MPDTIAFPRRAELVKPTTLRLPRFYISSDVQTSLSFGSLVTLAVNLKPNLYTWYKNPSRLAMLVDIPTLQYLCILNEAVAPFDQRSSRAESENWEEIYQQQERRKNHDHPFFECPATEISSA